MACGILFSIIASLSSGGDLQDAIKGGIVDGLEYYKGKPEFAGVYDTFSFLVDIGKWREDNVKSSGYVVDTLQAALWCLYTSSGYKEAGFSMEEIKKSLRIRIMTGGKNYEN